MQFLKQKKAFLTDSFIGTDHGCDIFIPANHYLYGFVKNHSSHTDVAQVASKALIIGRSLSASVERRSKENDQYEGTAAFYTRVAGAVARSLVGELAEQLVGLERLTPQSLTAVAKVHAHLCDAIKTVTDKDSSSFSSKYLHFHFPNLFPMVDSRARLVLSWVAEEEDHIFRHSRMAASEQYGDYCSYYILVRDIWESELGRKLSLRQMDNILLNRYDAWI